MKAIYDNKAQKPKDKHCKVWLLKAPLVGAPALPPGSLT